MTNNEIFRKFLHLTGLTLNKELTLEIFKLGGINATQSKLRRWRTSLDDDRASRMPDFVLEGFFTGLFLYRDMQREKGIDIFNFPR